MREPNLMCELTGGSLITPVTCTSIVEVNPVVACKVLPIGSLLPKYFVAASLVSTMELGCAKTFAGLPFISLKEKTSKKLESTNNTSFIKVCSFPFHQQEFFHLSINEQIPLFQGSHSSLMAPTAQELQQVVFFFAYLWYGSYSINVFCFQVKFIET